MKDLKKKVTDLETLSSIRNRSPKRGRDDSTDSAASKDSKGSKPADKIRLLEGSQDSTNLAAMLGSKMSSYAGKTPR